MISPRQRWAINIVGMILLVGSIYGYATASSEARMLDTQLAASRDTTAMLTDSLVDVRAVSDVLLAAQDSAQAADTAAVNAVAVVSDSTASETSVLVAAALELATDYPVIRDALISAQTALVASEEARLVERSTSAAALFASQQRERVLGMQLISERSASQAVIDGLRNDLSISIRESDAWERAAKPGALTQIWKQGRAAAVAVVIVLALK